MKTENSFHPDYLAIGGGMELSDNNPIVKNFIEHSGGKNSVITILPTASEIGDEIGQLYQDMFSELSKDVKYFNIDKREDVKKSDLLDRLTKTSGLFFTGGNQLKITSLLGGSRVMDFIRHAKQNQVFIAGTSAERVVALSSRKRTCSRSRGAAPARGYVLERVAEHGISGLRCD